MNKHSKLLDIDSKDTWAIYSKNRIRRIESIKEAARNALLSYLSSEG